MASDTSSGPLREIMDQTTQVSTDPAFGQRTLDLGSIFPNPSSSSTSPLASSIQSIPSYTPPAQGAAAAPIPGQQQQQGPTPSGGVAGGLSGSPIGTPAAGGAASSPIADIVGSTFNPNQGQDSGTWVSGPDSPTVLQGSSYTGGGGFDTGSSGDVSA
jgi:hypothetical protein